MLALGQAGERLQRIIALADELAARIGPRIDAHDRAGTFPLENYADLHAAGYLRLALPVEYGGDGANVYEMIVAQDHLGRGDCATAMATAMLLQIIPRLAEDRTWPEPVFAEVCQTIAREGGLINSVVTEPELGSVSRGGTPATRATPVEGGWSIRGHKIFATGAPALRYFLVGLTLPPTETAPQGLTANAIVPADAPGLRIEATWKDSLSVRSVGNDDVYLDDVFVPHAWMVDRRPIGGAATPGKRPGMNAWSLTVTAAYLGTGQAACDAACDYANNRVPPSLGKPIAELPHIQQTIGTMQIKLDAARTYLYDTAQAWVEYPDQRAALSTRIATAKYLCTNAACEASDLALRVAGGFSLTRNLPLERYFRDTRAGLFHPPQDDLALTAVGRAALQARRTDRED